MDRGLRLDSEYGSRALDGINLSVDWYEIEITNMISVEPALGVYQACLSPSSNPTAIRFIGVSTHEPQSRQRLCRADDRVLRQRGVLSTSGVDLAVDWRTDLAGGNFGVNFMVSSLLELKTKATASAPVIDWKGSLGPIPARR